MHRVTFVTIFLTVINLIEANFYNRYNFRRTFYKKYSLLQDLDCGQSLPPDGYDQVRAPKPLEFPWLVTVTKRPAIRVHPRYQIKYLGVMISRRWLITSIPFLAFDEPEDIFVKQFDDAETFDCEPYRATTIALLADVFVHPYWRENNIALVRLDRSLDGDASDNTLCFNEFSSRDFNMSEYYAISLPWQRPYDAPSMGAKIFTVRPLTFVYANFFEAMSNFTGAQRPADPLIGIYYDPVRRISRQVLIGLYESHVAKDGNETVSKYVRLSRHADWIYQTMFEKTREYRDYEIIYVSSSVRVKDSNTLLFLLLFMQIYSLLK